jgi:hypothetical protein
MIVGLQLVSNFRCLVVFHLATPIVAHSNKASLPSLGGGQLVQHLPPRCHLAVEFSLQVCIQQFSRLHLPALRGPPRQPRLDMLLLHMVLFHLVSLQAPPASPALTC